MDKETRASLYSWDKQEHIERDLKNKRNLDWYMQRYRRNISISLGLMIVSFIMSSVAAYNIKLESDKRQTFITSTSGDVISYEMTENKRELLRRALKAINNKSNG